MTILWGLVLLTLPVSTFRYFPPVFGTTLVRPLALYPLAVLLPLLLLQAWRQRSFRGFGNSAPVIAFIVVVFLATFIGALYAPLELRGHTYWGRALRAWVSFAVGLSFFLSALWMNRSEADLKHSLRWLYAGLFATVLWGLVQIVAINTTLVDKSVVNQIQLSFSLRRIQPKRISGFAYEPSWLADQLVILYTPWLFAALISGYRLTRHKWLELSLLTMAGILLIFSFSRSGIFNWVVVGGLVFMLAGRAKLRQLGGWFLAPLRDTAAAKPKPGGRAWAFRGLVVLLVVLALMASFSALASNPYFARLWELDLENGLLDYIILNSAGPRLVYAQAGLGVFAEHPWTGVGLGGAGLYLYEQFPDWALTSLPEVARQLSPDSSLVPNTKNLYVRLLAETGLVGLWFFAAFFLSVLGDLRSLFASTKPYHRYIGTAGLFIWLAVALRNFTQDSLASPVMWVGLGLVLGLASSLAESEPS